MPKVSVIVPTYNAMSYIAETVASILNQTFTDFELILIDDGSSDGTAQWITQVADPRVKAITQENKGKAQTCNIGIRLAQGEYLAFLDHDDLWQPTKLEKQVNCLDQDPDAGLVTTWLTIIDGQSKVTSDVMASSVEGQVWQQVIEKNSIHSASIPLIRRRCFETVGMFDETLFPSEDWDMWIRIAARYTFAVVKEPLTQWRQHANNTSNDAQKMLRAGLSVLEKNFGTAPAMQSLKQRCLGRIHLYAAWRAFIAKDYLQSIQFRQQARAYAPQLQYTENYMRLSAMTLIKRRLGSSGYGTAKSLFHFVKNLTRFKWV